MATALKLRSDIKKLKAAINRKETPTKLLPKLKAQLEKVENELASMKKGNSARKVSTTKGTTTTLSKLQKMVKAKKYSVYQGKGVDLQKDAGEGAFPSGIRVSKGLKANKNRTAKQNKGNIYYEYRPNRIDVKQPKAKQSYPKLEKGGETSDSKVRFDMYGYKNVNNRVQDGDEIIRVDSYKEAEGKAEKYLKDNGYKLVELYRKDDFVGTIRDGKDFVYSSRYKKEDFEDGGMMAKGGMTSTKANKIFAEYEENEDNNAHSENVVLLAKHFGTESDLRDAKTILAKHEAIGNMPNYLREERDVLSDKLYPKLVEAKNKMADGGETEEEEQKVIRGFSDDEAYEYAEGGMVEHGLKIGDKIVYAIGNRIRVENDGKMYRVNLNKGEREPIEDEMKHGGHVMSKTHRYDK